MKSENTIRNKNINHISPQHNKLVHISNVNHLSRTRLPKRKERTSWCFKEEVSALLLKLLDEGIDFPDAQWFLVSGLVVYRVCTRLVDY